MVTCATMTFAARFLVYSDILIAAKCGPDIGWICFRARVRSSPSRAIKQLSRSPATRHAKCGLHRSRPGSLPLAWSTIRHNPACSTALVPLAESCGGRSLHSRTGDRITRVLHHCIRNRTLGTIVSSNAFPAFHSSCIFTYRLLICVRCL